MDVPGDSAVPSEWRVNVTGGQGSQIGHDNTQYNLFVGPPPLGPVVAGNVPLEPPAFQPRDDLMARLRAAGPGVSVVRAVTGMRGVGKTQLAAAYARECIDAGWRLVAWVSAENTATTLSGLAVVAERLGIGRPGADLAEIGAEVRDRLTADGERCLIVFDNVTDLDGVRRYMPAAGQARAVVTSNVAASAALGKPLPVDVFTPVESVDFLAERTGQGAPAEAGALAAELGHLPLALAQAAAVITAQRLTYQVYLQRLKSYPVQKYLPASSSDPYPRGAAEAILLSVDALATGDPASLCGDLLGVISLLSPEGVSRDVLYLGESSDVFAVSSAEIDDALGLLADASLLTFSTDGSTVTAHRLVMRVLRERAASSGTLPGLCAKTTVLLGAWRSSLPEPWQNRPRSRDFVGQVTTFSGHFTPRPDDRKQAGYVLSLRMGALWHALELAESATQAIELGEQLLLDLEGVLGPDHPATLGCRSNLASAYRNAGRTTDAIPLHEQTLIDFQRVLGPDHFNTLAARNNLANAYRECGRVADAIPLHEQTLAERERTLGPHHPETLGARNNLANAYLGAGRAADAIPLHEQTLADCQRVLGPEHPTTLRSRNNLAETYRQAGRAADAIPLLEQNLADRQRLLGPDHPDNLSSLNNLALAYENVGRTKEATSLLERALAGFERLLGTDHPNTALVRQNLVRARGRRRTPAGFWARRRHRSLSLSA